MTGLGNIDDVYKHYLKLVEENQQLKELLKECKRYIDFWGYTDSHGNFLYPQIDNAIGEKNNGN